MRIMLMFVLLCAPLLCAQDFEAGERAFTEGRMSDAVDAFSKVLAEDPKHDRALAYRAAAYIALGKTREAEQDADAAVALGTSSSIAFNTRGYLRWMRGNFADAIDDYTAAIALASGDNSVEPHALARIHQNRGVAYQDQGHLDRALLDFNRSIELQPSAAAYLENRGLVFIERGLFDIAYRDFDRAVELEPRNARAYVNRAFAARSMDDFEQAVRDYSQALRLRPNYAQALIGRGHTWLSWGRIEPAVRDFEAAAGIEGFKAPGLTGLGDAAFNQGRMDEALTHYSSAYKADSSFIPARRGLTLTLIALRRFPDAMNHARDLCSLAPREARHWLALVQVEAAMNDHEQVIIAATRALELDASSVEGRRARLRAWALRGDYVLAYADAQHLQTFDSTAGLIERARVNALRDDASFGRRALEELKQAKAAGADLRHLKDSADFKSLRDDPDFKKLTAD